MKTDNRSSGTSFERELGAILHEHGFWVHLLQQNKSGQPADIIAVKGKFHTLIDCKVISDDRGFPMKRVEENQRMAMKMFTRKANEICWFAMKLPDGSIWMVSMTRILTAEHNGSKRISEEKIREQWTLNKWLESSDVWAEDV